MQDQKVHEYTVETGQNGLPVARLGKVHHLVTVGFDGQQYIYLDGQFVNAAGKSVNADTVPDEVKAKVNEIPFKGAYGATEQVLLNCEFCADILPSGQYAKHLADKHVRPGTAAAGTFAEATERVEATLNKVPGLDG